MNSRTQIDVITFGRVSMDLFAEQLGAPFAEIESFVSSVGGSPTNIAIGCSRLGLKTIAMTAVGADQVGAFVRRYLDQNAVDPSYIPTKAQKRTGMALLGIQPPDRFPLVFYREAAADNDLNIDDVERLPLAASKALLLSGTAMSRSPCREACLYVAESMRGHSGSTFHDLDLRPDQWSTPLAYGIWQRALLPDLDVVIGTEEEFYAALFQEVEGVMTGKPLDQEERTILEATLTDLLLQYRGLEALVLKRGAAGVSIFLPEQPPIHVPAFPVRVVNTVGAGDAFASGLIYSRIRGKDWKSSAQFANACGALVVGRHGCASAMPGLDEVEQFLAIS